MIRDEILNDPEAGKCGPPLLRPRLCLSFKRARRKVPSISRLGMEVRWLRSSRAIARFSCPVRLFLVIAVRKMKIFRTTIGPLDLRGLYPRTRITAGPGSGGAAISRAPFARFNAGVAISGGGIRSVIAVDGSFPAIARELARVDDEGRPLKGMGVTA
ncbi:hypothetical protein [Paenirhodobacter populi]|uniref:Uncharacterized protein n=1 Tax=Paenirhodobacter populi TaxID=2306993 RepID=A0A443ISQ5_9RHOB|nr:hypothetical protein [Sinirhodobacter populi]RWR10967.1 hypothetical protein D2T33_11540 [Sinirhodobacter populi]